MRGPGRLVRGRGSMSTRSQRPRIRSPPRAKLNSRSTYARDHGTSNELLRPEPTERLAPGGEARVLVVAQQESLPYVQAASKRGFELGLGHHVAASVAPVELLDDLVERRAVDHRVVRRDGHPDDVAELKPQRASRYTSIPENDRTSGSPDGPRSVGPAGRRHRRPRRPPRSGRSRSRRDGRGVDRGRRKIERLEDEGREPAHPDPAVVDRVGEDELVPRPGHRDVEEAPLLAQLDLVVGPPRRRRPRTAGRASASRPIRGREPARDEPRQVDDRELEALGLVDGQDRDGVRVPDLDRRSPGRRRPRSASGGGPRRRWPGRRRAATTASGRCRRRTGPRCGAAPRPRCSPRLPGGRAVPDRRRNA